MGCFSFICKKSGEPILSSSFSGDAVHLFLLRNGKVIEKMYGNYDSYGRVFKAEIDSQLSSFEWETKWNVVCDLMFSDDKSNGIAAILAPFWKEGDPYPVERSEDDPNQGWGTHGELFSELKANLGLKVHNPKHEIFL